MVGHIIRSAQALQRKVLCGFRDEKRDNKKQALQRKVLRGFRDWKRDNKQPTLQRKVLCGFRDGNGSNGQPLRHHTTRQSVRDKKRIENNVISRHCEPVMMMRYGVALSLLLLAGCGGGVPDDFYTRAPAVQRYTPRAQTENGKPLQCVPYARDHSGIKIYGDAYTWWRQAANRYSRSDAPEPGSVMVLYNYAGPRHAHVAVVRRLVSSREIRIDHANWMNDGAIYINNPVRDESADNDWSRVRVFNIQSGHWGGKIYPVQGFILPSTPQITQPPPLNDSDLLLAKFEDALAMPASDATDEPADDDNY